MSNQPADTLESPTRRLSKGGSVLGKPPEERAAGPRLPDIGDRVFYYVAYTGGLIRNYADVWRITNPAKDPMVLELNVADIPGPLTWMPAIPFSETPKSGHWSWK